MLKLSVFSLVSFGFVCVSGGMLLLRLGDAVTTRLTASNAILLFDLAYAPDSWFHATVFVASLLALWLSRKSLRKPLKVKKEEKKEEKNFNFEV